MQDFGQNIVFGEIFMKKFLSVVACLMLAFTCFAFVGCGNKGKDIKTNMPESYKIVTTSNSHTTDGDYTTTTTYIQGYYQNHAVVYMYEVNTGIYDYDKSYLWIAKETSTSIADLDTGDTNWQSNSKYWGDYATDYTIPIYWFDVDATGFYADRNLISSNATQLVYHRGKTDTIYISNDQYHYTLKREQTYNNGQYRNWTNVFSLGNFTSEIPDIAEYFAQLDD
jgi:hypothetical protein